MLYCRLVSACLSCLQSMFLPTLPLVTDHEEEPVVPSQCQVVFNDQAAVQHLVSLLDRDTSSPTQQIAICNILQCCCRTTDHQNILVTAGVLSPLTTVLCSTHVTSVQAAALQCLASMVTNNVSSSTAVMSHVSPHGKSLLSLVTQFTGRENNVDIQLAAGRVITYMYR